MCSLSLFRLSLLTCALVAAAPSLATTAGHDSPGVKNPANQKKPIELADMGSLMFGGKISVENDGNTFHSDHGYAQYFIPTKSKSLPVVMWHGGGQSGKSWESTPDGRDGFWQIFTRARWPVFIIDQPRRGRAGRSSVQASGSDIPTDHKESIAWNTFRLGKWLPPQTASFFHNTQFPLGQYTRDQFLRWQTPNTGPEPSPDHNERVFLADSMISLLKQTGPAILMTHSLSGQYGWETAIRSPALVKGIVAFEPGAFAFPENDVPGNIETTIPYVSTANAPQLVTPGQFKALTALPIIVIMGDNISSVKSKIFGEELWRVVQIRARQFVETVNRHGGNATLLMLPEHDIHGNTHFAFADKNNLQIAGHIEDFLHQQHLDSGTHPYTFQQGHSDVEFDK